MAFLSEYLYIVEVIINLVKIVHLPEGMKRTLFPIFVIVVLFIGSISSSGVASREIVHGKERSPRESTGITINVYSPDGVKKYTVNVSSSNIVKLYKIINESRRKLQNTTSMEDAKRIFNETVLKLAECGFIPSTDVKEIQKMVTGSYRAIKVLEKKLQKTGYLSGSDNLMCLVSGKLTFTSCVSLPSMPFRLLSTLSFLIAYQSLSMILRLLERYTEEYGPIYCHLETLQTFILAIWALTPVARFNFLPLLQFGAKIGIGGVSPAMYEHQTDSYYPSEGWLWTCGLKGVKEWDGKICGEYAQIIEYRAMQIEEQISNYHLRLLFDFLSFLFLVAFMGPLFIQYPFPPPPYYIRLPGIIGFTGISIPINPTEAFSNISDWDSLIDFCMGLDHFYMGFAVGVAVQYEDEIH